MDRYKTGRNARSIIGSRDAKKATPLSESEPLKEGLAQASYDGSAAGSGGGPAKAAEPRVSIKELLQSRFALVQLDDTRW